MTSRKRNKGKERRAKKAELEAEKAKLEAKKEERLRGVVRSKWKIWARGDITELSIECNHGVDLVIPDEDDHPVTNFIDAFFLYEAKNKNVPVENYLSDTFTRYQEVWDSERYREMAVDIFVAIGTNLLLSPFSGPKVIANTIVILEHYDGSGIFSTRNSRVVSTKIRDISGSGSLRDALKFYRKRVMCKCLKDMHLEARKTLPKTGMCYHCHEKKERALLMICSRCRVPQYCSRKCQVAHWPMHRSECDRCLTVNARNAETEP